MSGRVLTGRTILAIALGSFAVILTVNLLLAYFAVRTFSGLVVDNSYVASQGFDANRRAQEALGWTLTLDHGDAVLRLEIEDARGATVRPEALAVVVGRPTTDRDDRPLALVPTPSGYAAAAPLDPGAWVVMIDATAADGTAYRRREQLWVPAGEG